MLRHNPSAFRELAFGIGATLLFYGSAIAVPVAGIAVSIFTPLPTLLTFYRWGTPWGYAVPGGASVFGAVVLFNLGLAESFPYLLEMILLGLLLAMAMRRGWSVEKTVGLVTLAVFSIGTVLVWLNFRDGSEGLIANLEKDLQDSLSLLLNRYGGLSLEDRQLQKSLQKITPFLVQLLPGAAFCSTLIGCWLNLLVARRYLRVHLVPLPNWPEWSHWKAPELLVWLVIGSGILLMVPYGWARIVGMNVLIAVGVIYLFQGLAIAAFYFDVWKLPKVFRGILYAVILLQQFVTLGAIFVGLFDIWFDFRRISKPSPAKG